jgi:hypothetical protein
MGNTRRIWKAATVALLVPAAAAAQVTVQAGERLVCEAGAEPVGSLGITGIACDRCQFFTNGKVHRAVFWTEPTILNLDASNPAASVLREGDVLVAVDGQLITTRGGSARFSALPPDQPTRLRIRRDGRMMELSVPVAAACPTTKGADAPVVAGRPVPVPPPPAARVAPPPREVREPRGGIAVVAPAPPLPGVPEAAMLPSGIEPHATLGFGFRCDHCEYGVEVDGTGRWTFRSPPEVIGLDEATGIGSSPLRRGDLLVQLDGLELVSEEGGRRFANIRPGETLAWTVERDGKQVRVLTRARERDTVTAVARAEPAMPVSPETAPLRFSGTVGNTTIEVRGGRVNVTEDEGGRLVIIRTADAEIRIRVPGGDGGR